MFMRKGTGWGVGGNSVDPYTMMKVMLGAAVSLFLYPLVERFVDDFQRESYYNVTSCKQYVVTDPNNIPSDVQPISPIQDIAYSLIPLSMALYIIDLFMHMREHAKREIIVTSIYGAFTMFLVLGIGKITLKPVAEITCQAQKGGSLADVVVSLIGFIYPVAIGEALGIFALFRNLSRFRSK